MDPFESLVSRDNALIVLATFQPVDERRGRLRDASCVALRLVNLGPSAAILHASWLEFPGPKGKEVRLVLAQESLVDAGGDVDVFSWSMLDAALDQPDPLTPYSREAFVEAFQMYDPTLLRAAVSAASGESTFDLRVGKLFQLARTEGRQHFELHRAVEAG